VSIIRRLFVFIFGLAILVLLTILALAPEQVASVNITVRGVLVVLADLALVVVLFRQLLRRPAKTVNGGLMVRAGGAITDVSVDSARERILRAVREVPDVISASAHVEAIKGQADVDLDVVVSGSTVNIPSKQKEIDRALRQVIGKQLGLKMAGHPRVHIQFQQVGSAAPAVPTSPPVAAAVPEPAKPVSPSTAVASSALFGKALPREEPVYADEPDEDDIKTINLGQAKQDKSVKDQSEDKD